MGYMRHHSIIVTSWNETMLKEVRTKAIKMFIGIAGISGIIKSTTNGYFTFFIAPDG